MTDATGPSDVLLRHAEPSDFDTLATIVSDHRVSWGLFLRRGETAVDYLHPPARSGSGPVYAALVNGSLVGGGRIERDGISYFVAPARWRRGFGLSIARALLAEHACIKGSDQRVMLHIVRENIASRRIAERLGGRFAGLSPRGRAVVLFEMPTGYSTTLT